VTEVVESSDAVDTVDDVEAVDAALLPTGRAMFGVTGAFEYGPLRAALRASGVGARTAVGFAGLACAAVLPVVAVASLADDMARSFGGYTTQLSLTVLVAFVAGALAGAAIAARTARRAALAGVAGSAAAAGVALAAVTTFPAALACLVLAAGVGGVAQAVLVPVLFDVHPPEVRGRIVCVVAGGSVLALGGMHGAMALAAGAGLGWRAAVLGVALVALATGAVMLRTAEPAAGAWDEALLAHEAHELEGGLGTGTVANSSPASVAAELRRVMAAPTVAALLPMAFACGVLALPSQRYVSLLWRDELGVTASYWHRWSALAWAGGFAGLVYAGRRIEVAFRASPARLVQFVAWLATLTAAAVAIVAVSRNVGVGVAAWAVALAGVAALFAGSSFAVLSVTHPRRRTHAAALLAVSFAVGAQFGANLLDTIGSRFGAAWGLLTCAAVVLAAARGVNAALVHAPRDLDAVVTSIVEEESLRALVSRGARVPLLSCRGIEFAYGQLQVLFDVDFTVDDGEMVALLGTNGAGKSTLLRVISGLGLPAAGTVRFRGTDITYAGADRRVELGISQIPGGKAVFGPMTVADNLTVYGYTLGRDRAAVQRGIDATFEAFPRLAERRNQLAATLSGGEQQMLALAKALILRPQLLLIDELSLGLAPIVVGDLLKMVRRINDAGTAVVLVEQSVNIALELVHHAYFMEKGEVRFDGPAAELVERPDLLRSVFLEGASTAVGEQA
jgi:ABC-type branched-subunit amino acid transport system ATPase component